MKRIEPHIYLRGGTYSFRMAVPADLRDRLGRTEFKRALSTSDLREARRLAAECLVQATQVIEETRCSCPPVHTGELTQRQAQQFALERLQRRERFANDLRASRRPLFSLGGNPQRLEELTSRLAFFEDAKQHPGWARAVGRSTVSAFEEQTGHRIEPGSPSYDLLAAYALEGELEHTRNSIHREQNPLAVDPPSIQSAAFASSARGPSLGTVIAEYKRDRQSKWKRASELAFAKIERVLIDWFGRERSIGDITRGEVRELFFALAQIPTAYSRVKAFKGLKLREVIARNEQLAQPVQTIAEKTVTDYANHIKAVFKFAEDEQLIKANVAARLTVGRRGRQTEKREPFKVEELQRIFGAGVYADAAGKRDGYFWLPLIALFSGLRSGEIGQLSASNIVAEHGVDCFDLTKGIDLKTEAASRKVPVHSELIRIGFLEFVAHVRAWGGGELFPEINGHKDRSSEFSRYIRKQLDAIGLRTRGQGMHAFRHTVSTRLAEAGATRDENELILGWTGGASRNDMYARYTHASIERRQRVVELIHYPGLRLSHLYVQEAQPCERRQFD